MNMHERPMTNSVTETPAAPPEDAHKYFKNLLAFETDCWDVHQALTSEQPGFVLLDVRNSKLYSVGHAQGGAVNLPHREISEESLRIYPKDTLFVVYCAGPHCNGATKAAARLASLNRLVKIMIGGMTGWQDEGFPVVVG